MKNQLKSKALAIMETESDSLIFFKSRQERWLEKEVVGKEKNALNNFL